MHTNLHEVEEVALRSSSFVKISGDSWLNLLCYLAVDATLCQEHSL